MGGAEAHAGGPAGRDPGQASAAPVRVRIRPRRQTDGREIVAREGEVIGLAGLAGHGQTDLLIGVFDAAGRRGPLAEVNAPVALVAGDRQSDGVFPLWSIAENIGIRSLKAFRRGPLLSAAAEDELAARWQQRIKIRTPDMRNPILSLSGGNQQKALFARALGSTPASS